MATNRDDQSSILFNFENGASNVVNLDDNYDDDSDGTLLGDEFEDRFIRPTLEKVRTQPVQPTSNENVKRLDSLSVSGRTYRPGKTVELVDGDFLRITAIMTHQTSHPPSLKGIRFRRNKFLDGMLEFKRNEVTMLLEYDENDPRDVYHQSIKTVELFEILKLRELVKTNQPFPRASFRESDPNWRSQGDDYIVENGRIVCRTERVIISKNEGWIQFLQEAEADSGFGMSATVLRFEFRGDTILGGQCQQWLRGEVAFDEADRKNSRGIDLLHFHRRTALLQNESTMLIHEDWVPHHQQRYSFGDAFCGAGGISRGAKAAGLRIDWGFDFDPASIDSYRLNFHGTRCEAIAAHEFVTVIGEDFQVDILHLSPPCKTFSPFHVHPGQNDELNDATFFAIEELLKKVKPRIVTLEETFGLTRMDKNQPWFRAMIQVFTKLGFSVRWKVFNLEDFGLPQPRKRLFVFASCPGEPLPEFPARTHCKAADLHRFPHLSRFATVDDAIAKIPQGFPLHNPEQVGKRDEPPYAGNLPLRHTICCNGNYDYHPSGKRNFTLREMACLQGFPLEHQFGPMRTRIQLGNAVPPIVAKVFFNHIRKHLLKVDGLA